MPTIPTPYIGGSDSPRREQTKEGLAPPYHPEPEGADGISPAEEPEAQDALTVDTDLSEVEEVEYVEEAALESETDAVEVVAEAVAEPEVGEEAVLGVGNEVEDLVHIDVTEDEIEIDVEESELLTDDLEGVAAEEFAVGVEDPGHQEEVVTTAVNDEFFPDFLGGSDGFESAEDVAAPEAMAAEAEAATEQEAPLSSRERLARMADELRDGEFGNLIRALVDELGPYAADIAIARAFAAGYQAAKDREE